MKTVCTVQSRSLHKLVTAVATAGVSATQFFQTVPPALEEACLHTPEQRIPFAQLVALFEQAAQLLDDADFGLHLSEQTLLQVFDVFGYTILHSATLGEALQRLVRYYHLWTDGAVFAVTETPPTVRITYTVLDAQAGPRRQDGEYSLAMVARQMRLITGQKVLPLRVGFQHPAPASLATHQRIFGAPLHFAQPVNELLFARGVLELPVLNADAGLGDVLDRYAQEILPRYPPQNGLAGRLRPLLSAALRGGDVSVATLARQLQMSARSLQRKLQEEGTSYQQVLEQMRCELARQYLREPHLTISEVAYLLGFSETAAFHRAFRRWTGLTPGEFQRTKR
ncbi:MAG: AraC family transcriptional regulator [Blastocatellia bacterium]